MISKFAELGSPESDISSCLGLEAPRLFPVSLWYPSNAEISASVIGSKHAGRNEIESPWASWEGEKGTENWWKIVCLFVSFSWQILNSLLMPTCEWPYLFLSWKYSFRNTFHLHPHLLGNYWMELLKIQKDAQAASLTQRRGRNLQTTPRCQPALMEVRPVEMVQHHWSGIRSPQGRAMSKQRETSQRSNQWSERVRMAQRDKSPAPEEQVYQQAIWIKSPKACPGTRNSINSHPSSFEVCGGFYWNEKWSPGGGAQLDAMISSLCPFRMDLLIKFF